MSGQSNYAPSTGIEKWLDRRMPIIRLMYDSFVDYPTPKNLNYWWTFGAILSFMLVIMIVSGLVLSMHYVATADGAFSSVEHIMRDVNYGWLLRYIHANGGSMFFLAVYIHMFRGLYYGSYKEPREVLWILGVLIFGLMIATAFLGYSLPWGQMSYWAATVITGLFAAFPLVGEALQQWLLGGFSVADPTLNRFFSLHYLLPFVIFGVVVLHIWALHVPGNNNPLGIDVKGPQDTLPFHPYYTVKDGFAFAVFLILFAGFVFYAPNMLGHPDNYIPANPLVTPAHIVPEWYFLPFYAILRSIPDKLLGVIAMFASIAVLFVLPWLDTSKVRSGRFRPLFKAFFWVFLVVCIGLGWVGANSPDRALITTGVDERGVATELRSALRDAGQQGLATELKAERRMTVVVLRDYAERGGVSTAAFDKIVAENPSTIDMVHLGRLLTFYYFLHFLVIMPALGIVERPKPLPDNIAKPVLAQGAAAAGAAHAPER